MVLIRHAEDLYTNGIPFLLEEDLFSVLIEQEFIYNNEEIGVLTEPLPKGISHSFYVSILFFMLLVGTACRFIVALLGSILLTLDTSMHVNNCMHVGDWIKGIMLCDLCLGSGLQLMISVVICLVIIKSTSSLCNFFGQEIIIFLTGRAFAAVFTNMLNRKILGDLEAHVLGIFLDRTNMGW